MGAAIQSDWRARLRNDPGRRRQAAWEERRDRGQALATLGRSAAAAEDIAAYIEHRPAADDAPALRQQLAALRTQARPRFH